MRYGHLAWIMLAVVAATGCMARPMNLVPPDLGIVIDSRQPVREQDIAQAFTSRPGVRPGASIAIAYLPSDRRFKYHRTISTEEQKAWDTAIRDGFFITDVVTLSSIYATTATIRDVRVLRKNAAALNCDLLLIYSLSYDYARNPNPLSVLYLTIIGCFIIPGDNVTIASMAKIAVLDVRTGYVYGVVEGSAQKQLAMPIAWFPGDVPRMFELAATEAVTKARQNIASLFERMRNEAGRIPDEELQR